MKQFERIYELGNRRPAVVSRQRLAETAQDISRAGDLQLHLDACIAATVAFANVLFVVDGDGVPANLDPRTGRILIPAPWGASGWRRWGLRQWEAKCYRRLLLGRVAGRRGGAFDYDKHSRGWFVDIYEYPNSEAVLLWLKREEPNLREWRPIVERMREREAMRKAGRRGDFSSG